MARNKAERRPRPEGQATQPSPESGVDRESLMAYLLYQVRSCELQDLKANVLSLVGFIMTQTVMCSVSDVVDDLVNPRTLKLVDEMDKMFS